MAFRAELESGALQDARMPSCKMYRSLYSNALRIYVRFSYNPKVFRINVIPSRCPPGCTGVHKRDSEIERGESNESNMQSGRTRGGCGPVPDHRQRVQRTCKWTCGSRIRPRQAAGHHG